MSLTLHCGVEIHLFEFSLEDVKCNCMNLMHSFEVSLRYEGADCAHHESLHYLTENVLQSTLSYVNETLQKMHLIFEHCAAIAHFTLSTFNLK